MEEGSVMCTGMSSTRVMTAINILSEQSRGKERTIDRVSDYYATNVSDKVLRTLVSYTDYVNRVVWKKY